MDVVGNNIANVNTAGFKSAPARVRGHAQPGASRAPARPQGRRRWHQPGPGRPRRARRRHHHQLRPGRRPDHRPLHRLGDPGRRLLRRSSRRRRSSTPAPARSRSTPSASWSTPTAASSRAGRPTRRPGQHQRRRSATLHAADRPDRSPPQARPTNVEARRQPAGGDAAVGTTVIAASIDVYDSPGHGDARRVHVHQDRRGTTWIARASTVTDASVGGQAGRAEPTWDRPTRPSTRRPAATLTPPAQRSPGTDVRRRRARSTSAPRRGR